MNLMRKLLCAFAVSLLAILALPTHAAPQKIFSLQTQQIPTPNQDPFVPPFTVVATITNLSPNGNSTISSFTVSVTGLKIVGYDQPSSGTVTIDPTGASASVRGMSPLKPGLPFNLTLRVASCGDGVWSAVTWTGSNLSGNNFAQVGDVTARTTPVACGVLACDSGPFTVTSTLPDPQYIVTGQRGQHDKDGGECVGIPYYVTNTIPIDKKLHFRWPVEGTGSDSAATFLYTVTGTAPIPTGFPKVSWFTDAASDFITAPDCIAGQGLPTPYGALAENISKNATKFSVNVSAALPSGEFDIVIGSERMHVTKVTGGGQFFVVRAQGGSSSDTHSATDPVMSTPLPIMTVTSGKYHAGDQAQMCLVGKSGNSATVIDIGDGWVNSNP